MGLPVCGCVCVTFTKGVFSLTLVSPFVCERLVGKTLTTHTHTHTHICGACVCVPSLFHSFQINTGGSCCHSNAIVLPPTSLHPPPPSPICPAQRSTQAEREEEQAGERGYRGGGHTSQAGQFVRGRAGCLRTMSKDNQSCRLEASERLNGLGQKKRRPKKVQAKVHREGGGAGAGDGDGAFLWIFTDSDLRPPPGGGFLAVPAWQTQLHLLLLQ